MNQILGKERTQIEFQKYKILKRRHEKQKMKTNDILGLSSAAKDKPAAPKPQQKTFAQTQTKNQKRNKRHAK